MDFTGNENEKTNFENKQKNEPKIHKVTNELDHESSEQDKRSQNSEKNDHSENNDRDENSNSIEVQERNNINGKKWESEHLSAKDNENSKNEKRKQNKNDVYPCANCNGEFSKQKMVKCYICKQLTCKTCESTETHFTKKNDNSSYICKECFGSNNEKNR
jgi:cell division protein FtsN